MKKGILALTLVALLAIPGCACFDCFKCNKPKCEQTCNKPCRKPCGKEECVKKRCETVPAEVLQDVEYIETKRCGDPYVKCCNGKQNMNRVKGVKNK